MSTGEPFAKDVQTYLMQKYGMSRDAADMLRGILRERDYLIVPNLTIKDSELAEFAKAWTKFTKWIGI